MFSPVVGSVTKIGICYLGDTKYRYIQITDSLPPRNNYRLFYVRPREGLALGDEVAPWKSIGTAQNIAARYKGSGMRPHIHYEIRTQDGEYLDPEEVGSLPVS